MILIYKQTQTYAKKGNGPRASVIRGARGRRTCTNRRNWESNKEEITESNAAGWRRKASERAYPIERGQNISK